MLFAEHRPGLTGLKLFSLPNSSVFITQQIFSLTKFLRGNTVEYTLRQLVEGCVIITHLFPFIFALLHYFTSLISGTSKLHIYC